MSPLRTLIMTTMHSRKLQAVLACIAFLGGAMLFGALTERSVNLLQATLWSMVGITCYVVLCGVFGFDPHRTRVAEHAPALLHYVDRWELRLGQATLSMLGCVVVAAKLLAPESFVTAVVSGTLSAWAYFALRLYAGSYRASARRSR
jgi:hypothetical protein